MRWLLALMLVLCINVVNADILPFNTPDSHTATIVSGTWNGGDYTVAFDSNYTSFTSADTTSAQGRIYLNYTNSSLVNDSDNVYWYVKDGKGTENLTIPSACLDNNDTILQLQLASFVGGDNSKSANWLCHNGTAFIIIRNTNAHLTLDYNRLYDNTIYFNYTAPISPPTPEPLPQTQLGLFFGALMTIGIGVIIGRSIYENKRL